MVSNKFPWNQLHNYPKCVPIFSSWEAISAMNLFVNEERLNEKKPVIENGLFIWFLTSAAVCWSRQPKVTSARWQPCELDGWQTYSTEVSDRAVVHFNDETFWFICFINGLPSKLYDFMTSTIEAILKQTYTILKAATLRRLEIPWSDIFHIPLNISRYRNRWLLRSFNMDAHVHHIIKYRIMSAWPPVVWALVDAHSEVKFLCIHDNPTNMRKPR